jgi:putative PIN family toxin of toxin-antitoxin system
MKVLIDTNVLISAVLRDRNPESVILWVLGEPDCEWIVSTDILREYKEVLQRKKFSLPTEVLQKWEALLEKSTRTVTINKKIDFPRDQKDVIFLECSIASQADFLITGDTDFEEALKFGGVKIISVSMFKRLVMGVIAD